MEHTEHSNWIDSLKCSIFSSILKSYPERITFMFYEIRDLLDTFPQIKHEQSRTIMNKHESKTTILIEPQKAWLDRNKNIFGYFGHYFISGDILSDINFYLSDISLKCFDVESLPVSFTATYSMHPLFKPCCFERLFESGIHGRTTLWYNYERLPKNRN